MKWTALSVSGLCFFALSTAASAHHSFAMFETEVSMTLEGTVSDFVWTNPHAWIRIVVENDQGAEEEWAIEMGGPAGLARGGWTPTTLSDGMPVSIVVRPNKDGTRFAQFMAITLPDGTMMGNPDAPPGADAGGLPPR